MPFSQRKKLRPKTQLFVVFLLCQDLFQPCVAGKGIHQRQLWLTLDQGQDVIDKLLLETVALGVDPFFS